jgi:adenylate cyclase
MLALQVHRRDVLEQHAQAVAAGDPAVAALLRNLLPAAASAPGAAGPAAARRTLLEQPKRLATALAALEGGAGKASASGARSVQALLRAYAAPGVRYLNFYGPPRTVTIVAYADALAAARAASSSAARARPAGGASFHDKAVFVGFAPATAGAQDRLRDDYRTVYSQADGLDLSGVEIAATAFGNLLDGSSLRLLALPVQAAVVGAFGLVLAALCRLLRPLPAAFAVAGVVAVYLAGAATAFGDAALWLPVVVPVGLQAPVALLAGVWLRYRDTRREREIVKRAFADFLPSSVVDELVADPGALEQRSRVVFGTCISTDVEHYTTLAEQLKPAALGALMNEYYAQLFVAAERRHGVIVDLVGDATMTVWVGTPSEERARREACLAALEMAEAVERFNAAHGSAGSLPTRFGLHAGELLFGVVGASGHHEYRAVGDIVNTASRIQNLNKVLRTRILASEATVRGLDDLVVRRVGSYRLVGKVQAVPVVQLVGRVGTVGAATRSLCARFEVALQAYAERRWREAGAAFEALLREHPADGPCLWYRDACARLVADPPGPGWEPVMRIDTK